MDVSFELIFVAVLLLFALVVVARSIVLVPQGEAAVIERLGSYTRTISGGISLLVPFVDRVRARVDTRERVVSFPPQAVITQDNITVAIDTVVTFQINEPERAIYGVDNYIVGVEQISVATLRDVVGGITLEDALVSREMINRRLRGELDAATTKWGLRISRVELKAIDPPPSIQQAMELQMRAEREKRATILAAEGKREADIRTAEGEKQAQILEAEGSKHAAILAAEAERESTILRAEGHRAAKLLEAQGEARSIQKVNAAIKAAQVTPEVLAYQYLEKLPQLAQGSASTMWMIPMQFGDSLEQFAKALANKGEDGVFRYEPTPADQHSLDIASEDDHEAWFNTNSNPEIQAALAEANKVAKQTVDEAVANTAVPNVEANVEADASIAPKQLEQLEQDQGFGNPSATATEQPRHLAAETEPGTETN
ncbi:SPFH/Band 7/PHB domain protein [Corynebacterium sp. 153RC1]|uniref:SPFH domain-containing protein n=1 Tax=unclassified Corynebacterium TaxID=2624378 RepID=UPI00211BB619|nr:SPFH/Band 7/PHB domain protein [Corynebacterium sp. 209RC1]MCQ9354415.1 SPFH/Band 7/PHB domain protein [Corynebacterium sp. 1222RC1]MCQ9356696.1 SPFH/Band 7/PHB domain protein [Corynebacterium sp. 122RC1]MCQ9358810.1 SPFH/Band 7/PHB domain protein [Corynebacterium sp. 142RC1]MCQ9361208.1 SPFH/Band 7/PHB domain protein [Corynebacterium sp. 153RC1]MCQ9363359.1 SPFH/Band 7/PHB domain protein [Corynebacterium sp. 732RC1]MCQ9365009.1 SPFH/Band 7/PHB domain protein [Corynebacterium sp. 70RC1]MC